MYYSDDPIRDYDRYSNDCDNAYRRQLQEEIAELEAQYEDDEHFYEWLKTDAKDCQEVLDIYCKIMKEAIEEKREELRDI